MLNPNLLLSLTLSIQADSTAPPTPPAPAFEVASVKKTEGPNHRGGGMKVLPGAQTYVATNISLRLMIRLLYRLMDDQLVGGPDWFDNDHFDIRAKADRPRRVEELDVMFQALLVDRFDLKFHWETRALPAYALVVDQPNPRLSPSEGAEQFEFPTRGGHLGKLVAARCSMEYFADWLSIQVGRPVLDKTNLKGYYDFALEFTPRPLAEQARTGLDPGPLANGSDVTYALRKQLGLKLEPYKGPVQVMIVDGASKPASN